MAAYDLCAIEWVPDGISLIRDNRSPRITGFNAAGELNIVYRGEKKYNARSANDLNALNEEYVHLDARLLQDGWHKQWPGRGVSVRIVGANFIAVYARYSTVSPLQVKPVSERLSLLKELLNTSREDNRAVIQQLYRYAQDELSQLEQSNQTPAPELVELLERLSKLHREGSLNKDEFEQAKRKALGLSS